MKRKEKITGVLVDVKAGVARKATINKSLDGYYSALNCGCIDIVSRRIGGQGFDIVCYSKALLYKNEPPSAFSANGEPVLFGNLFIANCNEEGVLFDLREGQTEHVLRHVCTIIGTSGDSVYLIPVEW